MRTVTVVLHQDPETGWWADSPDVDGYTAADPDLQQLRQLVHEGLEFFLDEPVQVEERLADGVWFPVTLSGTLALFGSSAAAIAKVVADTSTISAWRVPGVPVTA